MNKTCPSCGAPIDTHLDKCPYCDTPLPDEYASEQMDEYWKMDSEESDSEPHEEQEGNHTLLRTCGVCLLAIGIIIVFFNIGYGTEDSKWVWETGGLFMLGGIICLKRS